MAASDSEDDSVYCICRQKYDDNQFMIQCDVCKDWFHGVCIDLKEYQVADVETYHCPNCQLTKGPSALKQRRNWHRHDISHPDRDKPVQMGTVQFIKELKTRVFPSVEELPPDYMVGSAVTVEHFITNSFTKPIIVDKKDGLGLTVPPSTFTVNEVEDYVGPTHELDVIDVNRQEDYKMPLRDWTEYFNSPNRKKTYNVISLEFSKTRLTELVIAPRIVRQLSWANNTWPADLPHDCSYTKPTVMKYCLMGVKDSYTDFHIDFGGSSVWYHILRGEKIFYLIQPTCDNVALYEAWLSSPTRSETFLADQVDTCYKCVVKQGQTIFLPSGWIHAVFTPIDTLVFGGNFLHDFNIESQIQVYHLEKRTKTAAKFMFPHFETSHWYKARIILDYIKDCNDSQKLPHRHMLEGGKAIATALKSWTKRKDFVKTSKYEVPDTIIYSKLLRDLNKELKLYDAVSPESSPKRTKKKRRKEPTSDLQKLSELKEETERKIKELQKQTTKKEKAKRGKKRTNSNSSLKVRLPKPPKSEVSADKSPDISDSPAPKTRLRLKVSKGRIVSPSGSETSPTSEKRRRRVNSKSAKPTTNQPAKKTKSKRTKKLTETSIKTELSVKTEINDNIDTVPNSSVNHRRSEVKKAASKSKHKKPLPHSSPLKDGSLKLRLSFHGSHLTPTSNKTDESTSDDYSQVSDIKSDSPLSPSNHRTTKSIKNTSPSKQKQNLSPSPTKRTKLDCTSPLSNSSLANLSNSALVTSSLSLTSGLNLPVIQGGLNGSISDILEASGYKTEVDVQINADSEYVPSPGTNEAIQGMLSMSGSTQVSSLAKDIYSFDEEEKLKSCYKDDDYIYPSLDMSDDEATVPNSRVRDSSDTTWNPGVFVNGTQGTPRDKLPRNKAKKRSVGTTLAQTAAKLQQSPTDLVVKKKRANVKKKKKLDVPNVSQLLSTIPEPVAGPSSLMSSPTDVLGVSFTPSSSLSSSAKVKKPKKGYATAKQRLGKILKIHKIAF